MWMFKTKILLGPWELSSTRGLWWLILGLSYSLQFSLYSHCLLPHHGTTDCKSFLYLISQSHTHTQSTSYLYEEWVMTTFLTFALDEGSTPDVYFPSWNKSLCLYCNSIQLQQGLFPCPTFQASPLCLKWTLLSISFILMHFISTYIMLLRHNWKTKTTF